MKNILFVSILVLFSVLSAYSSSPETWQDNPNVMRTDSVVQNPNYDAALARKLGADDYGMKRYILVILRTGPSETMDKAFVAQCFRGHMDNISRLADEGKLIVAGPLDKNDKQYRGIFILDAATVEEAGLLLETDPAIKEGLLEADLYSWYGSAALPLYLDPSDKIWKQQH